MCVILCSVFFISSNKKFNYFHAAFYSNNFKIIASFRNIFYFPASSSYILIKIRKIHFNTIQFPLLFTTSLGAFIYPTMTSCYTLLH